MKIVVAYKWTRDPEEARAGADGTVDWSRAKPGLSAYDPVEKKKEKSKKRIVKDKKQKNRKG
jgi:electron transfer flavoprotein beta subunit